MVHLRAWKTQERHRTGHEPQPTSLGPNICGIYAVPLGGGGDLGVVVAVMLVSFLYFYFAFF
ncbi:hypothetical protein P691DRAFT_803385 [Macrolepiota fuliginosa MF-IS2]|uniref:Uncharacterized protein n=1 Tax=Macrolepiota fuliginosa MF-IS2 TaxID=1400762 RepID=A0A9P6C2Y5_9AGAR|nr:hypothetical protein P691DRAFT_803385 [Macrolepiota fuliginosa MF-IS2]